MTTSIRSFVGETFLSIFSALPQRIKKILIARTAQSAGIPSIQYDGTLGTFLGGTDDNGVFIPYVLDSNWAPEIQTILFKLLPDGKGTYLDIGANIGLTTVPVAKRGGISCHAFEMEDQNFLYLRYNIRVNGVADHVTAHHCALFSEDTELEMEISDDNRGDHRVRIDSGTTTNSYGERRRRTRKAPGRRLDSILSAGDLAGPVVMKIDVQGAEVHVLRGAGELLAMIDFLILEFWPYGLARQGNTPEELFDLLGEFQFGAVLKEGEPTPPLSPIGRIFQQTRSIPKDGSSTAHLDLFLSKRQSY